MLFRVLVASALLLGRVGAATSTCGELRDAFVGAECCTAADETPVPFGDALSPPSLGSPPPPALSPPLPMPAGPAPPPMAIPTNYTGCDITIAGGGAGGIYSAWRLVKDVGVAGSSICIFEADTRLGGRIYSIRGLVRNSGPHRRPGGMFGVRSPPRRPPCFPLDFSSSCASATRSPHPLP